MISQNSTIGFIGLGAMGQLMARRLLTSGFKLIVYDHTSRKASALVADGAMAAPSVRQLARKSDVIISCLPNDEAVLSVYQGPEGVLACANPSSIVIEMSTVSPDTSRMLNRMGRERGIEVLDVAISGSTPAAEQGTLTLLGGGDANVFDACQANLFRRGEAVFPHGPERFRHRDEACGQRFARCEYAGDRGGSRLRREGRPQSRTPAASALADCRRGARTSEQAAACRASMTTRRSFR